MLVQINTSADMWS